MARPQRRTTKDEREEREERKKRRRQALLYLRRQVQAVCRRSARLEDVRGKAEKVVSEIKQFLSDEELSGGIPERYRYRLWEATERFDRVHQHPEVRRLFGRNKQIADVCKDLQKALDLAMPPQPVPIVQIAAAIVGIVSVVVVITIVVNGSGNGLTADEDVAAETISDDDIPIVDDPIDDTNGDDATDDDPVATPTATEPTVPIVASRRLFTVQADGFDQFDLITAVDPDPYDPGIPIVNGDDTSGVDVSQLTFTLLEGIRLEDGEPWVAERVPDLIDGNISAFGPSSYEIVDDSTVVLIFDRSDPERVQRLMRELAGIEISVLVDE
jgi:hypothetical protein